MTAKQVSQALKSVSTPEKAKASAWFFKSGPGQYGEGDVFIGVTAPEQRKIAKQFVGLSLPEAKKLLHSKIHEERMTALFILVAQYAKAGESGKQRIFEFYLENLDQVNNWDLVDSSAHLIVGPHTTNTKLLEKLAKSTNLWHRRVAMLATFHDIRLAKPERAFKIAAMLVNDSHDLIHKAVGWMLREIGKASGEDIEEQFLIKHYKTMPRTMLRYAIERFPEAKRKAYLSGKI